MAFDTSVLVAIISSASALVVATMTYSLSKRRERESEWRKLKLEHYKNYVKALSGVVGSRANLQSHISYADAVNSLVLVAPPAVLQALYSFQEVIRYSNIEKTLENHDEALSVLLREIRNDVHPRKPSDDLMVFHLMDIPPDQSRKE